MLKRFWLNIALKLPLKINITNSRYAARSRTEQRTNQIPRCSRSGTLLSQARSRNWSGTKRRFPNRNRLRT